MRSPAPYMAPLLGRSVTTQAPIVKRIIPHIILGDYAFTDRDPVFRVTRTAGLLEIWREIIIKYRRPHFFQGHPDTVEAVYTAIPGKVIHPHWRPATEDEEMCYGLLPHRSLPPGVKRFRNPRLTKVAQRVAIKHRVQIAITHQDLHSLHRGIFEHTVKGILGYGIQIEGGEFLYAPGTIDDVGKTLGVIQELQNLLIKLGEGELPNRQVITQGLSVAAGLRRARDPKKITARDMLESLPALNIDQLIPTIRKAALALGQNQQALSKQARALLSFDTLVLATIEKIAWGIQEVYEELIQIENEIKALIHPTTSGLTHAQVAAFAERAWQTFGKLILFTPFDPFRKRTFTPQVLRLQPIRQTAMLEGARGVLRSIAAARTHLAIYAKTT